MHAISTCCTRRSMTGGSTAPRLTAADAPNITRRRSLQLLLVPVLTGFGGAGWSAGVDAAEEDDRFSYLSANGNSNCSTDFMNAIATMPDDARLQGSCCSPMDRDRYTSQIRGLKRYAAIADIPPDPYDIAASLAKRLMARYDDTLTSTEQVAYQFAMDHSKERGPCCCECWRWRLYGGLGKVLIQKHQFAGQEVVEVWDLSDGCGGA